MTTAEKTQAINNAVKVHEDNRAAISAAGLSPGLQSIVIEALNRSLIEALVKVFAADPRSAGTRPNALADS